MTAMPLRSDEVDLLLCFHVLEHVPDDGAAMREIARVLAPDGIALVQVPWRNRPETDEDPSLDEDQRLARFGQRDHVRFYGLDFEARLTESGLRVLRVEAARHLSADLAAWLEIPPRDPIWLATHQRETHPARALEPTDLSLTFEAFARAQRGVAEESHELSRRVQQLSSQAEELTARNGRLRARSRRLRDEVAALSTAPERPASRLPGRAGRLIRRLRDQADRTSPPAV